MYSCGDFFALKIVQVPSLPTRDKKWSHCFVVFLLFSFFFFFFFQKNFIGRTTKHLQYKVYSLTQFVVN